jgi:hypothetical protein
MTRLLVAVLVGLAAVGIAAFLRARRPAAPTRDAAPVPRQLARDDFHRPDAPWLVAYFSSSSCDSCRGLGPKVHALESASVATHEASFEDQRMLHRRYAISAIPMILVADSVGVVQRAFVGSVTATDLWAAVAEVRSPGATPEPALGDLDT